VLPSIPSTVMNATSRGLIWVLLALIVCAILLGVLIIAADDMGFEEARMIRHLVSQLPYPPVRSGLEGEEDGEGDEFTGQAAAWTFGLSMLPVVFSLVTRAIIRYAPFHAATKTTMNRLNLTQKTYLMPLHYSLSVLALAFGVTHLLLSSCRSTALPEWGLGILAFCVGSGVMMKYRLAPPFLRKGICRLHRSLVLFSVLVIVLVTGHMIVT
jgi:hypothetical protein